MNLEQLLKAPVSDLPKDRLDSRKPFNEYLHEIFEKYLAAIDDLDDSASNCRGIKQARKVVQNLANGIERSTLEYLKGFPHSALTCLNEALRYLNDDWQGHDYNAPLKSLKRWIGPDPNGENTKLYRIRLLGRMTTISREDLFHVPFELRHRVGSQRYSISGLPSLYLSGSIWACWEEMQRPDFHKITLSRFSNPEGIEILDFGFRPSALHDLCTSCSLSRERVFSNVVCWPLIAACSIRVLHPNEPFAPEYIVPQLLLQWLRNEPELDGLRYFSTKITQKEHAQNDAMNYVFPVREQGATGFCPILQRKFNLTPPCAWSILTSTYFPEPRPLGQTISRIPLNEDDSVLYTNTEFFSCEQKLDSFRCLPVGSNASREIV